MSNYEFAWNLILGVVFAFLAGVIVGVSVGVAIVKIEQSLRNKHRRSRCCEELKP